MIGKILLTRHDKIGDFITALPMAKVLKEQTDFHITFLVSKINYPLASKIDFIDDVIVYKDDFSLIKDIKVKNFDLSVSAYIDIKLALILFLSGIKKRIAPKTKIASIFFNKTIRQKRSEVKKTEFEYNLDLLKLVDSKLDLNFSKPLVSFGVKRRDFIIFHPGFGGSSDGNLRYSDYLYLANSIKDKIDVVFTFGPDDNKAKEFFINKGFKIKDNFKDIYQFAKYIATSRCFISTSTGPMHLAGISNTKTISFFGDNLFASYKRWATVNDNKNQNNFIIPKNYNKILVDKIKQAIIPNLG